MKKYLTLAEGTTFYDDFGGNSNDIVGVRLNGRDIECLSKSGKWYSRGKAPENTKKLLWTQNGRFVAVGDNGNITETSVYMSATPGKYSVSEYVVEENSGLTSSKNKKSDDDSNLFLTCLKYVGKGLWWLTKGTFMLVLTMAMTKDNE